MNEILETLTKKISQNKELSACIAAGAEIEYEFINDEDGGITVKVKTKNPVAVKEIDGKTVVYERV